MSSQQAVLNTLIILNAALLLANLILMVHYTLKMHRLVMEHRRLNSEGMRQLEEIGRLRERFKRLNPGYVDPID